jgi:hypothetical protein
MPLTPEQLAGSTLGAGRSYIGNQSTLAALRAKFGGGAFTLDPKTGKRYFKGTLGAPTPAAPEAPVETPADLARRYAESIAGVVPNQPDIPAFANSGLYDESAAGNQYQAEFQPYWDRQRQMLDDQKRQALESMTRNQQATADTAAVGGQTGSGVAMAAKDTIQKGFSENYDNPNSAYQEQGRSLADQALIKRRDYLAQLKDEAYKRYQQRFQTQAAI